MENPVDEAPAQNQPPMSPSSIPMNANVVHQQHLQQHHQHHPQHPQHLHQLHQQHSQQHLQHLQQIQQHPQQYQYQYQTVIEHTGPAQHQPAQLIPNEKERHLQEEGIIPTYSKYPPPDQHPANFAPYVEPVQQYAVQHAEPVQQYAVQHSEPVQQYAIQHVQSPVHSLMQSPLHSPLHSPLQSPIHSPIYAQQHVLHHPYQSQQPQLQQQPQQQTYAEPPSSPGPLPVKTNPDPPTRSDTITIAPDANPLQSPKIPSFPARTQTQGDSSRRPISEDLSASHQPGQIMHPAQEVRGGGWSYGMCDCSNNIWACFLGLTLPCILYGKTQYRLNRKSKKEDPTNMLGYETCNGACTGMAILCGCQCKFEVTLVLINRYN